MLGLLSEREQESLVIFTGLIHRLYRLLVWDCGVSTEDLSIFDTSSNPDTVLDAMRLLVEDAS